MPLQNTVSYLLQCRCIFVWTGGGVTNVQYVSHTTTGMMSTDETVAAICQEYTIMWLQDHQPSLPARLEITRQTETALLWWALKLKQQAVTFAH